MIHTQTQTHYIRIQPRKRIKNDWKKRIEKKTIKYHHRIQATNIDQ